MGFDATKGHIQNLRGLLVAEADLHAIEQGHALILRQSLHRGVEIKTQFRIVRFNRGVPGVVALVVRFLHRVRDSTSMVLQEATVGDAVQPSRKARVATELVQLEPGQHESFLREIVRGGRIAAKKASKLRADHSLVSANQHRVGPRATVAKCLIDQGGIDARFGIAIIHACRAGSGTSCRGNPSRV